MYIKREMVVGLAVLMWPNHFFVPYGLAKGSDDLLVCYVGNCVLDMVKAFDEVPQ